jgi:tetratricopeptide (TPR) repeat protein
LRAVAVAGRVSVGGSPLPRGAFSRALSCRERPPCSARRTGQGAAAPALARGARGKEQQRRHLSHAAGGGDGPHEVAVESGDVVLKQVMAKLKEGKTHLQHGETTAGVAVLEEAISVLHGGLSDEFAHDAEAAGGASGAAEWSLMPNGIVREVLAEARFLAGTAAQKEGKWQRALLHFQSAMRDCPGVVAEIPAFLYGVATSQAVIGDDLDSALIHFRTYEKAVREGNFAFTNLQRIMLSFNIGQTLVRMSREEEAVLEFQAVFANGKNGHGAEGEQEKKERQAVVAAAHYWTAVAAGALKRHRETIAHLTAFEQSVKGREFETAVEAFLEKGWEQRYRARLISAMLKSDPEEHMQMAVAHAKVLCELAPKNPMYRRVLGECLFNMGDLAGAAEAFRFLLSMPHSPAQQDINVLLNLARCLHDLGELDSSYFYFHQVLRQEPRHVDATLGLAAVGLAQLRKSATLPATGGAQQLALPIAAAANSLRPPREEWMEKQAQGDAKAAASDADAPPAHLAGAKGTAAREVGDALGRLRALLRHRSSAADLAIRAEALVLEAELHDLTRSEQDGDGTPGCQEELLQEALKLCPNNFTALLRLAQIYHEQGKNKEVARLLAQAESLSGPKRAEEIRRHLAGSGDGGPGR